MRKLTKENVAEYIAELGKTLEASFVPRRDRMFAIETHCRGLVFVSDAGVTNGRIGQILHLGCLNL